MTSRIPSTTTIPEADPRAVSCSPSGSPLSFGTASPAPPEELSDLSTRKKASSIAERTLMAPPEMSFSPDPTLLSPALTAQLSEVSTICGFLGEEYSYLSAILYHLQVLDITLYHELTHAYIEEDPERKRGVFKDIFSKALTKIRGSSKPSEELIVIYSLCIELCDTNALYILDHSLKRYPSPEPTQAHFKLSDFDYSSISFICNSGIIATDKLAHSLYHLHIFTRAFLKRISSQPLDSILSSSNPLSTIFPLKPSEKGKIDGILASHPYFKNIPPELRKTLYTQVFLFLRQSVDTAKNFIESFNEFSAIFEQNRDSMESLRLLLSNSRAGVTIAPGLIKLLQLHFDPLTSRIELWVEKIRWIVNLGNKIAKHNLCIKHLYSYLQGDLSQWSSRSTSLNLTQELLAQAQKHPDLSTTPNLHEMTERAQVFESMLIESGSFIRALDSSWEKTISANLSDLMALHALLKQGIIQHVSDPAPTGSLEICYSRIPKNRKILIEDPLGRSIIVRFNTEPSKTAPSSSCVKEVVAEELMDKPERSAATVLASVSDFFKTSPHELATLFTAFGASSAFRNAFYYAEDLSGLLLQDLSHLTRREAGHLMLSIGMACELCLEQILTTVLLTKHQVTEASYESYFPRGRHLRLHERLTLCQLNRLLDGDVCKALEDLTESLDGLEQSSRSLPSSFSSHALLTDCHHIFLGTSQGIVKSQVENAIALGREVLELYFIILSALPQIANKMEKKSLVLPDPCVKIESRKSGKPGDSSFTEFKASILSKLPTEYHPTSEENAAIFMYLLDRMEYLREGLEDTKTFRFSELSIRLVLRNLVEEVLYYKSELLGIPVNRSIIGHDLLLLSEMLGLPVNREESDFLQCNSRRRVEAKYEADNTKGGKKKSKSTSSEAADTVSSFTTVMSDKTRRMLQRLDQETAAAKSIILKTLDLSGAGKSSKGRK